MSLVVFLILWIFALSMKKYTVLTLFAAILLFNSCEKDPPASSSVTKFVFGFFNGHCQGEKCIELYKLENGHLYEDLDDKYPVGNQYEIGNYTLLSTSLYREVSYLRNIVPAELLQMNDTILGCPDCADQGGLYIEYHTDTEDKRWILDQNKFHVPAELHSCKMSA